MRDQTTIDAEIAALKAITPRVRRRTLFGDDNHAAIDAQIEVLASEDPEDAADDFDLNDEHVFMAARDAVDWLNEDESCKSTCLWKRSKPAARLRSRKYGSVKLKSTWARSMLPEKPSLTYWPLPIRLRSVMLISPMTPSLVE